MREQLTQYVNLLFAGTTDTYDIQQEILQNTLDKYDDLIAQGWTPEAAYRQAISGIGDIDEILGRQAQSATQFPAPQPEAAKSKRKLLRSIAIALYIICAIPVILFEDSNLGVCLTLLIAAIATAIIIIAGKDEKKESFATAVTETGSYPPKKGEWTATPQQKLRKSISSVIWIVGICFYLLISFASDAWFITWLVFLILPAIQGLVNAIFDLKEAE